MSTHIPIFGQEKISRHPTYLETFPQKKIRNLFQHICKIKRCPPLIINTFNMRSTLIILFSTYHNSMLPPRCCCLMRRRNTPHPLMRCRMHQGLCITVAIRSILQPIKTDRSFRLPYKPLLFNHCPLTNINLPCCKKPLNLSCPRSSVQTISDAAIPPRSNHPHPHNFRHPSRIPSPTGCTSPSTTRNAGMVALRLP